MREYDKGNAVQIGKPYSHAKNTKYEYYEVEGITCCVYSNLWEQDEKFEPDEWATQLDTTIAKASSAGELIDQLNKLMAIVELLTIELGYQFHSWIDENTVLFTKDAQS